MLKIRSYLENDYPSVRKILKEAKMFDKTWDSKENYSGMIKNDNNSILVATQNDHVVGNIILVSPSGSTIAFLFRLAVKKEYRKKRIGSKLIYSAEAILKKNKVKEVGFFVDGKKEELHKYYKNHGYKTSGKQFLFMWKPLYQ